MAAGITLTLLDQVSLVMDATWSRKGSETKDKNRANGLLPGQLEAETCWICPFPGISAPYLAAVA